MCGGSEVVGSIPEAVLDFPKQFGVGPVDKLLGHPADGLVGGRPEAGREGVDAGLAIGVRGGGFGHGDHPGVNR